MALKLTFCCKDSKCCCSTKLPSCCLKKEEEILSSNFQVTIIPRFKKSKIKKSIKKFRVLLRRCKSKIDSLEKQKETILLQNILMKNLIGLRILEKKITNIITDLKISGRHISLSQVNHTLSAYRKAFDRMDQLDLTSHTFLFADLERSSLVLNVSD